MLKGFLGNVWHGLAHRELLTAALLDAHDVANVCEVVLSLDEGIQHHKDKTLG